MKRLVLFAVLMLIVAACGDGSGAGSTDSTASGASSDSSPADTPDTTENPESDDSRAGTTTTASSGSDDDSDGAGGSGEVSTGSVTVAGETYEFHDSGFPGVECDPDMFGAAFFAVLQPVEGEVDGVIGSLVVSASIPGQEYAEVGTDVTVSLSDVEWVANPEHVDRGIPEGSTQVDSLSLIHI